MTAFFAIPAASHVECTLLSRSHLLFFTSLCRSPPSPLSQVGFVGCAAPPAFLRFPPVNANSPPLIHFTPLTSSPFSSLWTPSSRTALCLLAYVPSLLSYPLRARDILALQTPWIPPVLGFNGLCVTRFIRRM